MNKTTMLLGSALLAGLVSCNKSEFEGFTKSESGLHYKFFAQDEKGVKATEGDGISINIVYALKREKTDSVLYDSRQNSEDGSGVVRYILPKSSFKGSLEEAISMMSKNDSAAFIISADSFFLKTNQMTALPPFAKPGDKLQVTVKLLDIKNKKELEENQKKQEAEIAKLSESEKPMLDKYLADNKITTAPTESGLIYIELKKGKGPSPKPTDVVTAHYHGTFLDGTVFDSSIERGKPVDFPLNKVIPGWTEGLGKMAKGGKAKLIVPSSIGYGPQGRQGGIPPFSTLVFEVELIDFKAGASQ